MASSPELDDYQLAQLLAGVVSRTHSRLTLVVDGYRAKILVADESNAGWSELACGDLAEQAIATLHDAVRNRRVRLIKVRNIVNAPPSPSQLNEESSASVTLKELRAWLKAKIGLTSPSGRQGKLSEKTKRVVEREAQWRCQFDGCGEDLREHVPTGADGNFSYFAHIVAASVDGPRGDEELSAELVDEPSNIMLLCDKCHRLIDRVAPDRYLAPILQRMRANHIEKTKELLDNLRFPASQPIFIGGNIAGQYAQLDTAFASGAMRAQGLRVRGPSQTFIRNGSHLGNNTVAHYWASLFEQLRGDVPALRRLLNGDQAAGDIPENISVFPLHNMSILALAGRVVGEARTVNVFQFDRNAESGRPGVNWGWQNVPEPATDKFKWKIHAAADGKNDEAVLLVYLTAAVPIEELPASFQLDGQYLLPTVEVTVDSPNVSIIGRPEDLRLAGIAIGDAMRIIFDEWRATRLHVIPIAPASACFRLGQKLQARHQAHVSIHERVPINVGNSSAPRPFVPTIDFFSDAVSLPDGSMTVPLI